jgi:small subunit ribosomal protein S1
MKRIAYIEETKFGCCASWRSAMSQKVNRSPADASFSMDDFAKALAQYDYAFQKGQKVQGKVLSYESEGAYVDIGAKSPGILPAKEASLQYVADLSAIVPIGEEREFIIIQEQNADGQVTLSLKQLQVTLAWEQLAEMQANNQSLSVRVTGANKGGVTVDAQGLRGFIPRSHLLERDNLDALKGQVLTVNILELSQERDKLVLSNRLAARSASFSKLELGQLVEGQITSIKPFGVFVEFDGTTGLLHINQVSQKFIPSLPALFQVGQPLKAIVVNLEEGKGRISLSTKVLENFPGEMVENSAAVMAEAESRHGRARKAVLGD